MTFIEYISSSEVQDVKIQVNIQNEFTSTSSQTRSKKHREIQTETENQIEIDTNNNADNNRLKKILDKKANLIESALIENNETLAFKSNFQQKLIKSYYSIYLKLKSQLDYDVDWYGGNAVTTNPFTLINQQLLKEEEVIIMN